MKITDYGSLRARAAYPVDNFLPYGFVGLAMGQANINRRADAGLYYHVHRHGYSAAAQLSDR